MTKPSSISAVTPTSTCTSPTTSTTTAKTDDANNDTTDTATDNDSKSSSCIPPHDCLRTYICQYIGSHSNSSSSNSSDTKFGRFVLEHMERDGYVVLPNILTLEECEVEYNRLWDFVQATAPTVRRDDPTSWYPHQDQEQQSKDPWPHSGWKFLQENCQSNQAGWLFSELREILAKRVFEPLYGTNELHSSKEGFTFFRPTAAPPGYIHPCMNTATLTANGRQELRVCNQILHTSVGEHFDQRATHTGLQCIQSSTAIMCDNDQDDTAACFLCWPGSHRMHAQMTKNIWRGRSDWVPLTDNELDVLRHAGYAPRRVPVKRGSVILWRSDLVHCGAPPVGLTTQFRSVSYTCMLPAALTPPAVRAQKLREYCLGLSGDHRPNVSMPHLSQPKKQRQHKTTKGAEVIAPSKGRYFDKTGGLPKLTWRQAQLYGLVDYNHNNNTDKQDHDDDKKHAVRGADGRLYWNPPQEMLQQVMRNQAVS